MPANQYEPMEPELRAKLLKEIDRTKGITLQQARSGQNCDPYRVRLLDPQTKKRVNKSFVNTDDLVQFAKTKLNAFESGTEAAGRVTLKAVLPVWLQALRDRGNRPKSVGEIERLMTAAIEAGVNNLKAEDIAGQVSDFLANYQPKVGFGKRVKPRSPSTMVRYIGHFRALAAFCCRPTKQSRRALLNDNPFLALELPQIPQKAMPILTIEQARTLVSDEALRTVGYKRHPKGTPHAGEIIDHPYEDGLYYAVRIYTGMRRQEVSWLRWEHVMWDPKLIRVILPDAVDHAEAVRLKLPNLEKGEKPDGSDCERGKQVKGRKERFVNLADELIEILIKIRPEHGRGYIFRDEVRSRDSSADGDSFRRQLKRFGIVRPDMTPHDLRSTSACLWLAAGLSDIQLVTHLGHTTVTMTKHYANRANEYRAQAVDWKGEIRLRSGSTGSQKGAQERVETQQNESPKEEDKPAPEDEIDDCVFVILPEKSPLFADSQQEPQYDLG